MPTATLGSARLTALVKSARAAPALLFAVFLSFGYQYFLTALGPEVSREGAGRHLPFAADLVRTHRVAAWPESLVDVLDAYPFAIARHSAAALLHFSFLIALIALILSLGARTRNRAGGALAALLVFVSPVVAADATSAGSDVARAAVAFACFYVFWLWRECGQDRLLGVAVVLFGATLWSARGPLSHFPAVINSVIPAAPLAITTRGDRQLGFLGPVFLLLPVSLLAIREKLGRYLLLAGGVMILLEAGHMSARTLIPALPFLSFAFGLVLQRWPGMPLLVAGFHIFTCWPGMETIYANQDPWRFHQTGLRAAFRMIAEERFLAQRLPHYQTAQYLNANQRAKVLALDWLPAAYIRHEVVFDPAMLDALKTARTGNLRMRWSLAPVMKDRQRIMVRAPACIAEVRILGRSGEIARSRFWTVTAPAAFDNNPASCFRAEAGSTIEVAFGSPLEIAGIVVDASDPAVNPEGVTADPQIERIQPSPEIKHAAADYLWAHGFTHIVMPSTDPLTQDFRTNWLDWTLYGVAEFDEQSIYVVMERLGPAGQ